MLTKQTILIFLLSLTVISPAMAKIYKWTDANGKMHYTSTPPPANIKVKESKELKIHKTKKSSLTFKHKPSAPIAATKKKKKNKVKSKKSVRNKNTTANDECENISLAKRQEMMKELETNGNKALARGHITQESHNEIREMFRQAIIDCKK